MVRDHNVCGGYTRRGQITMVLEKGARLDSFEMQVVGTARLSDALDRLLELVGEMTKGGTTFGASRQRSGGCEEGA